MARISTYGAESDIVGGDKWIGTAVNQNNATKNFTADAVAAFLNSSGSINSQTLRYTYKNVPIGDEREKNSLSFLTELGASVAFSSITNFVLSQYSKPGTTDVSTFYDAPLVGSNILLTNASNPKDWAIYTWNSSTQIVLEPLFYDIGLTFVAGTGGLVDDADYIISLLEYDSLNTTETLENTLIAGNNSGANGIFFDGATKAVFNTDLQIYSDAVIGYILADTLHIETENDISLKSDTQVTFNILNSDKLKITSLGVTVEGRVSQTTLGESTFFGDRAGENDDLTNRQNTSFGFKALQANILGTSNTAIGYSALLNNTGESNTAIGFASLTTNTLGIYNTGVGIYSLRDNLSGIYNTAFGTRSLISNTSGNYNISVGVDSLGDNT
jgi:hypothetical protein